MTRGNELFILTNIEDNSSFVKATEEDMMGIYELGVSWNSRTSPYEARLKSHLKNPYIYYIIKKEEVVIGFLGLIPFTSEALTKIMNEPQSTFYFTYSELLGDEKNIVAFKKREKVESLFIDIAVRQDIPNHKQYGMRIIKGLKEVLLELARQGIAVRKLHASSSVPDAIRLCQSLKFTELPKLGESSRRCFELDLETADLENAGLSIFKDYQQRVTKLL